jgi:site-specific DNA recombinase
MENRIDAIYARQSVDRKDSISIESQIEFCRYELKGGSGKEYKDKGFSGKNTDRPQFQELMWDIEKGLVRKVVVYKLDRISRSILDFANMMEQFQKYGVEFVSSTEKFDTSTPMGRAMLNICIVFAQLERETIQKRVSDAYYSRSLKGFRMGSKAPYGFHTEPVIMQGIRTKKLVPNPEEAEHVRLMFEMYARPETSYGDIVRYFAEHGIKDFSRPALAVILCNPVYVWADLDIYEFFKGQGTVLVNEAADFTGTNGCYFYRGRGMKGNTKHHLQGHTLVLAPSEGFIPSDLWLKCRKKILANASYQAGRKAVNTWLAGKIKCGRCGKALKAEGNHGHWYFRCSKRSDNKSCEGAGTLRISDMESFIYTAMVKKLKPFQTLNGRKKAAKANPKLTALQVELVQLEGEIEKLLDTLTGANSILLSYVNSKIEELDGRKQTLIKEIAAMTAEAVSPEQIERISGYLGTWEKVSFDDRRQVVDALISSICATSEKIEIQWKI